MGMVERGVLEAEYEGWAQYYIYNTDNDVKFAIMRLCYVIAAIDSHTHHSNERVYEEHIRTV